ncbi:hypothetical protein HHK36_016502 [Tetracentron sinense]|uniref:Macrophage erythroblast attacher n=1 Tax=Tetracentron sinense TaxID=13715 RepID=A0A834Z5W4_TETSI|nr:hypothetical protein HHK36_016502 [Tetracentron sinense]
MESTPSSDSGAAATDGAASTGAPVPPSRLTHLAESLKLEHQFLRVPLEYFKKSMRTNHRIVEKEMSAVFSSVSEAVDRDMSKEEAVHHLTTLVSRLQGLKRKLEEGSKTEHLQAQRCRIRLDHLDAVEPENLSEWNNTRMKRILVDYMLRLSYYDTAMKLAESNNLQDLVDIDVFHEAKKVIDALQKKEVAPALAWCAENKSRLKKSKSKFEFQLRLQEFIELVRADNHLRAITYARKYLAPWGATHMKELQRVMATLAFKSNTECATYKVLYEPKQWDYLVEQFKQEFCRFCYEDDCPKEDPLSQESFRKLASSLPFSKQHHSKLVCYITKELMDTENPPLVLPNGYVYSSKALEEMAKKNDGKITCPRTGLVCNYSELVKAYIS